MQRLTTTMPLLAACLSVLMLLGVVVADESTPPTTAPDTPAKTPEKAPPDKATLNEPVPPFTLHDTEGTERSLADYEGRIVVLEWTNPECPYVDRLYRNQTMQKTVERAKEIDKKIVWLAINSTANASARANQFWIDQQKIKHHMLLDPLGVVGKKYDARRTPHMFVIDREGVLRYHGAIDDNPRGVKQSDDVTNYVLDAIEQIEAGEKVAPDYVKPYGCSVKYARGMSG